MGEFEYIPKELTTIRLRDKRLSASYFVNGRTYIKFLRQRYGRRARGAIRQAYNHLAGVSVHEALRRMDAGDRWGALILVDVRDSSKAGIDSGVGRPSISPSQSPTTRQDSQSILEGFLVQQVASRA